MKKTELLFIPGPGMGHLASAVEFGKLLINRDEHLSIVYIIIDLSYNTGVDAFMESQLTDANSCIRFVNIPYQIDSSDHQEPKSKNRNVVAVELINRQKPLVRDAVLDIISKANSDREIAGIIVDMFCVGMIDVAHEFELPSYMFYTSSAGFLGLMLHVQSLHDEYNVDITDYKDSDAELLVPSFSNPVPAKVLPTTMLDKKGGSAAVVTSARRMLEVKGIIVNTFHELESYAIKSLSGQEGKIPRIYPIGPIINWNSKQDDGIMSWLDTQPSCSVVFLCFGSLGSFSCEQVKEIAVALEHSRCRFLWSLRQPPAKGEIDAPSAYANPEEVLPEGFLQRTSGVGKVIGWAPQMAVLSHPAVGGFVSHCGWNSILESLWAGVPIAAWPMYAEQQTNAFEVVAELGIAVEIKMDYRNDANMESKIIVSADEIENGIKRLMMDRNKDEIREKVKDLKEICRQAIVEEGSSYISLAHLIENFKEKM
ncbi:anthocyanidin 3-O-glucosyltransferase 2-like [Coffea eugenioides]|uniref:anthocyanidin 3-O-glucosyltransferase 2-like n=1 Tax=Coffea eugenioides TaxID=49369 RepID=UPI000F605A2E|nr:anthocyanidin 3-O-glucosyltransferase 2-like [Coffea eugenioides]XP_027183348.1 anthocyanidin 3-O-glucosyltransferase 2-like [Coffea eugenioides]